MSGILYLGADDFAIRKGEKGNLLCLNYEVQGLTLVLFYSNECQHSTKLMIKYKQLPFNINGCQFTMINVNRPDNRKVVQMAGQTIVPITYVPDIILYVDGVPYMRYDGKHDIHAIKSFILDIYQQLQKTAFMDRSSSARAPPSAKRPEEGMAPTTMSAVQGAPPNVVVRNAIPAYTIGKPKCSGERDDVCYLSFKQAYDEAGGGGGGGSTPRPGMATPPAQPVFYNTPM